MAVSDIVKSVCVFLSTKDIILPPDNKWLNGCIEWYKSENVECSLNELQEFALQQLLLADLKLIAHPVFPPGLSDSQVIELGGKYFAQINYFLDVGESAYCQYQKLKKQSLINLEVDEETTNNQPWEPKSSRMLKMEITDGVQTLYGMEYSPILKLNNDTIIPGIKILINGPVECRSGVILLKEQNIVILGGEEDSLCEIHHTNRVIARALNFDENMLPINENIQETQLPSIHTVATSNNNTDSLSSRYMESADDGFDSYFRGNVCEGTVNNAAPYDLIEDENDDIFLNVPVDNENIRNSNRCIPNDINEDDDIFLSIPVDDEAVRNNDIRSSVSNNTIINNPNFNSANDNESHNTVSVPNDTTINQASCNSAGDNKSDMSSLSSKPSSSTSNGTNNCVVEISDLDNNGIIHIDANVTAFKSKLEIKNNTSWNVTVRINSSEKGSMKATFDPDLLDKIIGFNPTELASKENEVFVNPAIKEKLNKMLFRGQQVIKNLKCRMVLLKNENELPVIIEIDDNNAFYCPENFENDAREVVS